MNQSFLKDILRRDVQVVLFGAIEARPGLQIINPDYEVIDADGDASDPDDAQTIHTGRIVPVYEKAGAMTPKLQRRLVFDVLSRLPADLPDAFPDDVRRRLNLPDRRAALMATHFPPADTPAELLNAFRTPAQVRLIFEEFFLFQLGLMLRKRAAVRESKPAYDPGRRSHPRIGAPYPAVQADGRAADRAERDRRGHAAFDADEPAAPG